MRPHDAAREVIAGLISEALGNKENPAVTAEKIIDALEGRSLALFARPGFVDFARAALDREDD